MVTIFKGHFTENFGTFCYQNDRNVTAQYTKGILQKILGPFVTKMIGMLQLNIQREFYRKFWDLLLPK